MAIRFRRSVRILPGLRMNFSGSGIGLSIGVPGARVTVGPSGLYRHLSLPGTGIYSRERIRLRDGGKRASPAQEQGLAGLTYRISTEDPTLRLLDYHTEEPLPESAIRWLRKHHPHVLPQALEESAEEFNEALEAMERIHLGTPAPSPAAEFAPEVFSEPRPEPPEPEPLRGLTRFLPSVRQRHEAAQAEAQGAWQAAHAAWEERAREHQAAQIPLREAFAARDAQEEAASAVLAHRLETIRWPRETLLDWDVRGDTLWMDVDLPTEARVPRKRFRVLQRGLRLGVTELSDTQVRRAYMGYVHGALFRIAGEAFHALPAVQRVVVSGFTQEIDGATGEEKDTFLVSVQIPRGDWETIRFDALDQVDPVPALARFPHRRNMTATGIFRAIVPFSADDS